MFKYEKLFINPLFFFMSDFVFARAIVHGDVIKVEKIVTVKLKHPFDIKVSDILYVGRSKKITIQGVSKDKRRPFANFLDLFLKSVKPLILDYLLKIEIMEMQACNVSGNRELIV